MAALWSLQPWFCFHVFFSKPSNVVAPFDMADLAKHYHKIPMKLDSGVGTLSYFGGLNVCEAD